MKGLGPRVILAGLLCLAFPPLFPHAQAAAPTDLFRRVAALRADLEQIRSH